MRQMAQLLNLMYDDGSRFITHQIGANGDRFAFEVLNGQLLSISIYSPDAIDHYRTLFEHPSLYHEVALEDGGRHVHSHTGTGIIADQYRHGHWAPRMGRVDRGIHMLAFLITKLHVEPMREIVALIAQSAGAVPVD
jgi:hypothetical protein